MSAQQPQYNKHDRPVSVPPAGGGWGRGPLKVSVNRARPPRLKICFRSNRFHSKRAPDKEHTFRTFEMCDGLPVSRWQWASAARNQWALPATRARGRRRRRAARNAVVRPATWSRGPPRGRAYPNVERCPPRDRAASHNNTCCETAVSPAPPHMTDPCCRPSACCLHPLTPLHNPASPARPCPGCPCAPLHIPPLPQSCPTTHPPHTLHAPSPHPLHVPSHPPLSPGCMRLADNCKRRGVPAPLPSPCPPPPPPDGPRFCGGKK